MSTRSLWAVPAVLTALFLVTGVESRPAPRKPSLADPRAASVPSLRWGDYLFSPRVVRVLANGRVIFEQTLTGRVEVTTETPGPPPPPPVAELETLAVPATVESGRQGQGSLTLSGMGPGTVALLSSSGSLSVPATVTVPAGARTATFALQAATVRQETVATVTATLRAVSRAGQVRVLPAPPDPPDPPDPPEPPEPPAAGWFVSPSGRATNAGTRESPWSIASAVDGTHRAKLAGGGTVWLTGGTYRLEPSQNREGLGYRVTTSGTAARPLVYRAAPGQRVVVDGGWSFMGGASYCWLQDVTITVSDLVMGRPPFGLSGSWPEGAPNGGVNFYTSESCKAINNVVYRNRQGFSVWTEARNAEVYGNVIADNGWIGSDRSHGHGIYAQSPASTSKLIENNIITHTSYSRGWRDGRYGVHGYGERVAVTNITLKDNLGAQSNDAWLLDDGAVLGPSTGHRVLDNVVYGVRFRLGARADQPLEFRGNLVAGALEMPTGAFVSQSGNLIAPPSPRPSTDQVILKPNRYEPARAHLMALDWDKNRRVSLDTSGWMSVGERVKVLEPTDQWGAPVWQGAWPAGGVELPVEGARVLILQKDGMAPGLPPVTIREEAPVLPRLRQKR